MLKQTATLLLFIFSTICNSQTKEVQEQAGSSKSIFEIKVDSTSYILQEDEKLQLSENLKNPVITVHVLDYKKFETDFISFDYPKNFSYEFESFTGYRNWNFDGNNYIIMLFDVSGQTTIADFVAEIVAQFGEDNSRTEEVTVTLGNRTLKGIKIIVEIVGQHLVIDFFKIGDRPDSATYISFQDTRNEDGSSSTESQETYALLDKTVIFKE